MLKIEQRYSIEFYSDIGVVVQYGWLDVQQPGMTYMAPISYRIKSSGYTLSHTWRGHSLQGE